MSRVGLEIFQEHIHRNACVIVFLHRRSSQIYKNQMRLTKSSGMTIAYDD